MFESFSGEMTPAVVRCSRSQGLFAGAQTIVLTSNGLANNLNGVLSRVRFCNSVVSQSIEETHWSARLPINLTLSCHNAAITAVKVLVGT